MHTTNAAEIAWLATSFAPNVPAFEDFGPQLIDRFGLRFPMVNEDFLGILRELSQKKTSVFQMFDPN